MNLVRKLVGGKTYLSPMNTEAAELWYRWHNDRETALLAGSPGHRSPGALEEYQQTIESYVKSKDRAHAFLIVDLLTDLPIGWCALFITDAVNRRASLSILLGEKDFWGHGYGEDALRALLSYGFELLNLNSVELIVHEENERARRCYEKLGFRMAGRKRQARLYGSRKLDNLMMDLLAEEFTVSPAT
ncbi:MAG: GNAT family protein [Candidatus Bipolaricaulota bacterium]